MNVSLLSESWRTLWPGPWIDVILSFVAIGCGIVLGSERQRREKPAGLRTLSLVCLGSCAFTMASFAFTTTTGDSGRVAAQIVTGIGFLGAGVILHGKRMISGMTTAATIWIAAAIGMIAGAGYGLAALGLAVLVNRMLVGFTLYETRWHPEMRRVCVVLEFNPLGGITRLRLERVLNEYNLVDMAAEWAEPGEHRGRLTLKARMARLHLYEMLNDLVDVPEVHSFHEVQNTPNAPKQSTAPLP